MKRMKADIAVIGGGAAGMLAAAEAAERGFKVTLFESGTFTGKKLRITGKGRCNVTNNCLPAEVLANVPTNGRFLYSAVNNFTPEDAMTLFENLGVKLKTERGNRVFPVSDKAEDIVAALRKYMKQTGVSVVYEKVTAINASEGRVVSVATDGGETECGAAILCTGGVSYPLTGSTGDGYAFAKKLGHTIVPPKASLVPLCEAGDTCRELAGLSLRNVSMTVFENNKKIYEDFGELLFTHFGLSGPLVLSASSHMRKYDKCTYRVEIDLKPALDAEKLDKRLLSDFNKYKNSDFINSLGDLLPRKMIPVMVEKSQIDPRVKVNSITKEERKNLCSLIKAFPIEIKGPRPVDEAIITSGGVSTKEINPTTMESKFIKGLYFAGEIIDVDAYTGGFNLQIAWATAHAAATHAEVID